MTEENENNEEKGGDSELLKNDGKDLQRITSWIGRVEANTKKQTEMLSQLAEKLESAGKKPQFGDDDRAKFNEKLHSMILEGNVMEALSLVNDVNEKARAQIKAADRKKFQSAIEAIADDPVMKNEDLSKKVSEIAERLVGSGKDAATAVSMAKMQVENEALRSMHPSAKNLDLLGGGGKRIPQEVEAKLPEAAEREFKKGFDKGLFKDRQEYIDMLDPRVKEQWGL